MKNKACKTLVFLFSVLNIFAGMFILPAYAKTGFVELKTDNYLILVDTEKANSANIPSDPANLDVAQLSFRTISENTFISYISLPDGGNMLVNTGALSEEDEVKDMINTELTKMSMQYDLMKLFGWKPRIDWIVLTCDSQTNTGGLPLISSSFEIKALIIPSQPAFPKIPKVNLIKVPGIKNIDLQQVVSPVELTITCLPKGKFSRNYTVLKYLFSDYSFSFLLDLTPADQKALLKDFPGLIDSTVLFSNVPLIEDILLKTSAVFVTTNPQNSLFITDGKLLYVKMPEQIKSSFNDIITGVK